MGTVFTRRFEADQIGSQVPLKLMHLEGLYELFVSKFAFSTLDISMHLFKVNFTMKLTYKTLPYEDDEQITETTESGGEGRKKTQWDDDCPWSEWYSAEDPVKGFEFVAVWSEKTIESSMEMAELENASIHEAEKWFIFPELSPNLNDVSVGSRVGFASQIRFLVDSLDLSLDAQFLEDFVSGLSPGLTCIQHTHTYVCIYNFFEIFACLFAVESSAANNSKSSAVIPPPTVLDRVLKDLFHEGGQFNFSEGEHKSSRMLKGAPLESLFAQFCLHALWFGDFNIRGAYIYIILFFASYRIFCASKIICGIIQLSLFSG
jgi:Rab3 GTPase-activating protein catalytic subunit